MGKGLLFKHAEILDLLELWAEIGNIKFINNTQPIRQRIAYKLHLRGHPRRSWNNVSLKMGKLRKSFEKCNQHNRQCVFNGNHAYRCRYYMEMSRFLPSQLGDIEAIANLVAPSPHRQKLSAAVVVNSDYGVAELEAEFTNNAAGGASMIVANNCSVKIEKVSHESKAPPPPAFITHEDLPSLSSQQPLFPGSDPSQRINCYPIPEPSVPAFSLAHMNNTGQLDTEAMTAQYDDDASLDGQEVLRTPLEHHHHQQQHQQQQQGGTRLLPLSLLHKQQTYVGDIVPIAKPPTPQRLTNSVDRIPQQRLTNSVDRIPPLSSSAGGGRANTGEFRVPVEENKITHRRSQPHQQQPHQHLSTTPTSSSQRDRYSVSNLSDSSSGAMDKQTYRRHRSQEGVARNNNAIIDIASEFSDSRIDLLESMKINQRDSHLDHQKQQDNLLNYYRQRDDIEARDRARDRILREADLRLREKELQFREHVEKESERRHQELLMAIINRM